MKYFIILIICCIAQNSFSQDYVKNIRVNQINNEIQIFYDLGLDNKKGYFDSKHRVKSRKFKVIVNYSTDNGKSYKLLENATGDIGKKTPTGKNKKIIWRPSWSKYGFMGKIIVNIDVQPKIPKLSWGLTFCQSFLHFNKVVKTPNKKIQLNLYASIFKNTSLTFPISYNFGSYETTVPYRYNPNQHDSCDIEIYKYYAFTFGVGFQTNKRIFSFYVAVGPSVENIIRKKQSSSVIGSFEQLDDWSYVFWAYEIGLSIKVFDIKPFTFLIPINAFIDHSGISGNTFISTGLAFQF